MLSKEEKKSISEFLEKAESTVSNTGRWAGDYGSINFWIGDKSGSRINQYECSIFRNGLGIEVRAKTYSTLIKKVLKSIDEWNLIPSANGKAD